MDKKESEKLAKKIGLSVILGIIVGFILYATKTTHYSEYIKPIGTIFLRLLKMIIVPLVFTSVYMAMLGLGSPENLGKMGKRAVIYYLLTTSLAVFIGLVFASTFDPGKGTNLVQNDTQVQDEMKQSINRVEKEEAKPKSLVATITGVIVNSIPTNPIEAMAKSDMLQVIVFALLLGMTALFYQQQAQSFTNMMQSLESLSHHLTHMVMRVAPYGVFALMTHVVASAGLEALAALGKYMLVVLFGLLTHSAVLIAVASYYTKKSPIFILKSLSTAIFTAFSTSSSSATLPITMSCVIEEIGVREKTANFVLPLGATINMDGTALYVSVATIFIAQAYGVDLSMTQLIIIFLTASLAAVGTAAIPGASIFTMGIVLGAVGLPMEGIQLVIAVDRILDMFRTVTNVLGDSMGSCIVDKMLIDKELKTA